MEKKLSKVIKLGKHIAPYKFIEIVSGVGSGKNYWVENVLMEQAHVLLITSRKSKVKETMNRTEVDNCLNLYVREQDIIASYMTDEKPFGNCVCNSWQIEYYMKHIYVASDRKTHLWNFFDLIVVDEAHSLATDATFCDAPFYLCEFIKAVYREREKRIILMTATPDPIQGLIKFKKAEDYAFWDFTEQCDNIIPKKLTYVARKWALSHMAKRYRTNPNGKRHYIYFATRTKQIREEILPFLIEQGIPEKNIAVSFSNEDAEEGFSATILENKKRTEEYLEVHEDIPDDIKIFITTSRNKEGINIKNKNYSWNIIIESHWIDEIKQMWGRVRININAVFLVYDAPQHQAYSAGMDFDYKFDVDAVNLVNKTFDSWCEEHDIPLTNRFQNKVATKKIEMLCNERFPYLRYSPNDDKFHLYEGKILGMRSFENSIKYYDRYIRSWLGEPYDNEPVKSPFPIGSIIVVPKTNKDRFEEYAQEKGFFDKLINKDERQELLDFINHVLRMRQKKNLSKPYVDLSKAIREWGYTLTAGSKNKNSRFYGLYKLERIAPLWSGEIEDDSI